MRDEGLTTEPELSASDAAVNYLLQRVRVDADLRWLMIGTEALARLCEAEAARTSQPVNDVRAFYQRPALHRSGDRPRIVVTFEKLERIQSACEMARQRGASVPPKLLQKLLDGLDPAIELAPEFASAGFATKSKKTALERENAELRKRLQDEMDFTLRQQRELNKPMRMTCPRCETAVEMRR